MIVTAVTNRKGGSGKTALATNLAALWAQGLRCLLIDMDMQGDASIAYGLEDSGEALAAALAGRAPLEAAIQATAAGVDVAPAGEALGALGDGLSREALRRALSGIREPYDAVVLDCATKADSLAATAWHAATTALVPVNGPEALRAVARLRRAWDDVQLPFDRARIVVNCFDGRQKLDQELVRQATALYGAVARTRVRKSVVVAESAAWRRPLVLHAPRHWVTDDMRALARELYHG